MNLEVALTFLFWLSLLVLAYTFVGYPLVVFILARLSRNRSSTINEAFPFISVVLAAHNEQDRIQTRLNNLLSSDYPADRLEIIVVSDGSTDETIARGEALGDQRIRVVPQLTRSGKATCLNTGVSNARGEIIVLGDMRQRFQADTIRRLVAHFADKKVGAVSGALEIEKATSAVGGGVDVYWRLEKFIRKCEARIDSSIGCTGAVYAIRRDAFRPIPPDTILDDVVIPMQIALSGYRVLFDPAALAYDPQTLEPAREKVRKQRTLAGNFQMMLRYPAWCLPWVNRLWWQLISHKYLRLAAPFLMALLFVVNAGLSSPFFRLLFVGQCAFYSLAIIGRLLPKTSSKLLSIPAGFVFLNFMTLNGLYHHLRGSYRGGSWPIAQTSPRSSATARV